MVLSISPSKTERGRISLLRLGRIATQHSASKTTRSGVREGAGGAGERWVKPDWVHTGFFIPNPGELGLS